MFSSGMLQIHLHGYGYCHQAAQLVSCWIYILFYCILCSTCWLRIDFHFYFGLIWSACMLMLMLLPFLPWQWVWKRFWSDRSDPAGLPYVTSACRRDLQLKCLGWLQKEPLRCSWDEHVFSSIDVYCRVYKICVETPFWVCFLLSLTQDINPLKGLHHHGKVWNSICRTEVD